MKSSVFRSIPKTYSAQRPRTFIDARSMSLLSAAVELLRDTAHRHGASIDEDTVRHELGAVDFSRAELVEYLRSDNVHKLLTTTCTTHVDSVWAAVRHLADAFIPKPTAAVASTDEDMFAATFDAAPHQHVTSGRAPTTSLAYELEEMSGAERATAMHFTNTAEDRARREAKITVPTAVPVPPASPEALLTFAEAVAAMRSRSSQSDPGAASSAGVAVKGAPPPEAGMGAPPPDASAPPPEAGNAHEMAGMSVAERDEREMNMAAMHDVLNWVRHTPEPCDPSPEPPAPSPLPPAVRPDPP